MAHGLNVEILGLRVVEDDGGGALLGPELVADRYPRDALSC